MRAVILLIALLCAGCAEAPGFRRVTFQFEAGGLARDATQPLTVRTPLGWDVTFAAAELSCGPIYFRNAPPTTGTTEDSGRIVTEVLDVFTVDALDPDSVRRGDGVGSTEPSRAAEVRFTEATSGPVSDTAGPGGALAHVAGIARKDGVEIAFDGVLTLPAPVSGSAAAWFSSRRARRIPVDFSPENAGTLRLVADPTHWLDAVAFEELPGQAVRTFDDDTARSRLLAGLVRPDGYALQWIAP